MSTPTNESERPAAAVRGRTRTFRILPYFSLVSLVCIAVAAAALTVLVRNIAIKEIVSFGESANVALAQTVLLKVRPELLAYLDKASNATAQESRQLSPPEPFLREIEEVLRIPAVKKIKIYNTKGVTVFSSHTEETGGEQDDNDGVVAALGGKVVSELIYRDQFNALDSVTEEDNLIQTYIPVAAGPGEKPRGAFEIYVDVNPMVVENEKAQWGIVIGAVVIMLMLYLALLAVVRRAERIISEEQRAIRERSATLEQLSAKMLSEQEAEKKKIAFELHEGVAQTLSAVKVSVEGACARLAQSGPADAQQLGAVVDLVKAAIGDVRTTALNLRPSSLDDLGLIATLHWFCREFKKLHPHLVIEAHPELDEADMPASLKAIVYRVIEDAAQAVAAHAVATRIDVDLAADAQGIELRIHHNGEGRNGESVFDTARQRTVLSGGEFQLAERGSAMFASWLR